MNTRTRYFLILSVAAALVAAGCATEPAVEIMMDPDAPVAEAPRELGVGTVRTYNTVNGETYELAYTIAERQEYKGNTVSFQTLSTHTVNGETYELAYTIAERQEYKGVSFQTLSTPVRDPPATGQTMCWKMWLL